MYGFVLICDTGEGENIGIASGKWLPHVPARARLKLGRSRVLSFRQTVSASLIYVCDAVAKESVCISVVDMNGIELLIGCRVGVAVGSVF